jgi:hypothetical protein
VLAATGMSLHTLSRSHGLWSANGVVDSSCFIDVVRCTSSESPLVLVTLVVIKLVILCALFALMLTWSSSL